jgi:hypothetical protein
MSISDLGKQAEVWVRLTFKAADGDMAMAYRRMISPPLGDAQLEEQIDPQLETALRLAEIGVLMPARLTKIGFGKNSLTLYEAVKQLTGLDQLSDVAEGCAAFGAGNRKFMKYAKDQGIENYERRFAESIASAKQLAEEFELKLPEVIGLGEKNMDVTLKEAAKMASEGAGKHLETLKSEISATIDTSTAEGRNAVKTAVSSARGLVTQGPKAVPLFQTWKALTDAASDAGFASLPVALETAKANITTGLEWHNRQTADGKLRLKALAAQSFTPVKGADADCPLCTAPLDDEAKRALSVELEELKTNAAAAERKIADVCRGIRESVTRTLPNSISDSRTSIDKMDPAESYVTAVQEKFVTDKPFSSILTGLASSVKARVESQKSDLPHFTYGEFKPTDDEPEPVTKLRHEIHVLERLIALVKWWKTARPAFGNAWSAIIGKKQEDGTLPADSVEGKLVVLEQALEHARPLDDLSKHLGNAAATVATWDQIVAAQKTREAIKEALEPLKALRLLVAAETASSIATLSGTINSICERICLKERLAYEQAVIGRKEISVTGSFTPGMRIDAALVANTSWLRDPVVVRLRPP